MEENNVSECTLTRISFPEKRLDMFGEVRALRGTRRGGHQQHKLRFYVVVSLWDIREKPTFFMTWADTLTRASTAHCLVKGDETFGVGKIISVAPASFHSINVRITLRVRVCTLARANGIWKKWIKTQIKNETAIFKLLQRVCEKEGLKIVEKLRWICLPWAIQGRLHYRK